VNPDRVLELGAHYDTFGNPGADDNCSGVAGVLEAARILAEIPTERSIRFCLYDLEEVGCVGSQGHVKLLQDKALFPKGALFDGAIVLEMIGYSSEEKGAQETPVRIPLIVDPPRTGDFILVLGNLKSGYLGHDYERAIEMYVDGLEYYSMNRLGGWFKDAVRSDHSAYWRAGLPAIVISDTANLRNPNYHRESDTTEPLISPFSLGLYRQPLGRSCIMPGPCRMIRLTDYPTE